MSPEQMLEHEAPQRCAAIYRSAHAITQEAEVDQERIHFILAFSEWHSSSNLDVERRLVSLLCGDGHSRVTLGHPAL